jgi:hypothetical protein
MKTNTIIRSVLFTGICLLASKVTTNAQNTFNLTIPNQTFSDQNSPILLQHNFPYSDQYQEPYNHFPTVLMFNGWEVESHGGGITYGDNPTGSVGTSGTYSAVATSQDAVFESYNPITTVANGGSGGAGTIANNAVYTLTFALNTAGGTPTSYALLATTQAVDMTTQYSYGPYTQVDPSDPSSPYVQTESTYNPNPLITTQGVLASGSVDGSYSPATYTDVSITFNTLHGNNAALLGDGLSIYVDAGQNDSISNFRLTEVAVVPEPSTWALMLAGLAGLFIVGRRKLKASV